MGTGNRILIDIDLHLYFILPSCQMPVSKGYSQVTTVSFKITFFFFLHLRLSMNFLRALN